MYKRIIGLVLMENGYLSRTRNFVPDYQYSNNFIDSSFFDEMVFIDISRNGRENSLSRFSAGVEEVMLRSQLPISLGGSIASSKDIECFRAIGADRYVLNQTKQESDLVVSQLIAMYGRSSIISSINHWGPYIATKNGVTKIRLIDRISEISENCGTDILLNSVERDGTFRGFDLESIDELAALTGITFIVSGGLGNLEHLSEALSRENVVGVCTNNVYHLTTNTISNWRSELISRGFLVRQV